MEVSSENQLSRRNFIKTTLEKSVLTLEGVVFLNPFCPVIPILANHCFTSKDTAHFPYTDRTHILANQSKLRNLGVLHIDSEFYKYINFFEDAVYNADIVLLEDGKRKSSNYSIFFEGLVELANKNNKPVIVVDDNLRLAKLFTTGVFTIITSCIGLCYVIKSLIHNEQFSLSKRLFCKLAGWSAALFGYCPIYTYTYQVLPEKQFKNVLTLGYDYRCDARTVKMLDNTLQIVDANPGKKILLVTGNFHALGIEHYLENPDNFNKKLALYNKTYFCIGGKTSDQNGNCRSASLPERKLPACIK